MDFLNSLLRGFCFIHQAMSDDLDFVCDNIEGVYAGKNGHVILQDPAYFIVRVLDHVERDCEGGCK